MARISIGTPDKASPASPPEGIAGASACRAYFNRESDPLHLYEHRLDAGSTLHIGPMACDCVGYVWEGSIRAGDTELPHGSSLVVEHGAEMAFTAGDAGAVILTFAAPDVPKGQRPGGHVHLLPDGRVPRYAPEPGAGGASGGLHANGLCPTCEVWLHENTMPGMSGEAARQMGDRGVHSHSEDEIIFVTGGTMRLGAKLYGPGTALAIAADTMYSFTPGLDGLSFINFRAGHPEAFRMKNGGTFDEAGYWNERVTAPQYL